MHTHSVAFSKLASSPRFIEDEIFNDIDIITNLVDYEDGQKPDSLRANKIFAGIHLSNKLEKYFLEIDTNSERSLKFQKELRSCISSYRDVYIQHTNRPSPQKHFTYFILPKNKSIGIVSSSDESDLKLIPHRTMHALDNYK
ncbi:uncharacterized protein TNCV_941121 [Trichonephila clavipes]|nr:uncharacterized protein TNCV_941121 [Trichonephila clavipes]